MSNCSFNFCKYIMDNSHKYIICLLSVFQVVVVLLYFTVLLGLYMVPLYITSPCIMDPNTLKQRPDVIGHQGAPMVSQLTSVIQSECAFTLTYTFSHLMLASQRVKLLTSAIWMTLSTQGYGVFNPRVSRTT